MSLPRYPEYKDSGVAWLGTIPSHWRADRFKASIESSRNGIWGDEPQENEGDIACVRVADFDRVKLLVKERIPTLRYVTEKEREGRALCRGNLLLEKSGGGELQPVGQVVMYHLDAPAVCSNFVAKVVLKPYMAPDYWNYVHSAAYAVGVNIGSINQTSGIQNLDADRYFNERAPFPPFDEQTAIATFLDRETAKIDALIAEQEKLLTLLAEKRQATISHAVTKGLNPDAPMKDSGVEWLGEVPAHWDIFPLRRALASTDYGVSESLNSNGKIAVLRMGNIAGGKVILSDLKYLESVDESLILEPGDLLFNRTNSLDLIAKVGLFEGALGIDVSFASYLVRLRLKPGFSSLFFSYLLNISAILGEARASAFVAIGQCNLNPNRYGQIVVPIPPADEQATIATFLETEIKRLGALTAEVTSAIDLLKERRTALISAAVTGKIDVRHLADQEAA